MNFNS